MADLSDVTAYLASAAASAIYPNGTSQPSVAAMDCLIYEGWPLPDALDLDVNGKMKSGGAVVPRPGGPRANVSVFPLQGTGVSVYQILDETYTITPPAVSLGVTVSGTLITLVGQPSVGEYLTLVVDDTFIYSFGGASTAALLSAMLAAVQVNFPAASATSSTITVPFTRSLVVRQGGKALQGKVTHRQRHSVAVTVWAPNPRVRTALCNAIDVLIKKSIKVTMPDTSQAIVCYNRTNVDDSQQSSSVYRRDLVYEVEYATLETFPAYVVTSTDISIISAVGNATAHSLT